MEKPADNQDAADVLADTLTDAEIDLCDECGREYSKKDIRTCRKCSERLCGFCMDLHECEDEYGAKPKKGLDKLKRM